MATISGTVTIGASNTPGQATVVLFNYAGDTIVATTVSDPVTGAYEFTGLSNGTMYRVAVMGGGVYRSRAYGPCTPQAKLDDFAVPVRMALSFKQVVSSAVSAMRVRNSSNVELDIGFSNGVLDTAALLGHAAGGSCWIRTWYDQSGNSHHAEQPVNAKQARIVNAGVYDGAAVFSGGQGYKVTGLVLGTPQVGLYARYKHDSTAGVQVVAEMTTVGSSNNGTFLVYTNAGATTLDSYNSSGSTNRARSTDIETATMAQQTYLMDRSIVGSGELALFKDGAARSSSEVVGHEQTGNYLTNDLYIGARAESSIYAFMTADTFVIYNADTAAIRSDIEGAL